MDDGRRCALPGCDEGISSTDGRPERRYCTAAHRLAARRARRAAGGAERPDDPPAPTLPWLREPAVEPSVVRRTQPEWRPVPSMAGGAAASTRSTQHGRARLRPFGRRALVLLGVAGLLAGGYALSDAATADAAREIAGVARPVGDPPRPDGVGGREREDTALREDLDTGGPPPGQQDARGRPSDADRATMAELRERVMRVARDARKEQAAAG